MERRFAASLKIIGPCLRDLERVGQSKIAWIDTGEIVDFLRNGRLDFGNALMPVRVTNGIRTRYLEAELQRTFGGHPSFDIERIRALSLELDRLYDACGSPSVYDDLKDLEMLVCRAKEVVFNGLNLKVVVLWKTGESTYRYTQELEAHFLTMKNGTERAVYGTMSRRGEEGTWCAGSGYAFKRSFFVLAQDVLPKRVLESFKVVDSVAHGMGFTFKK
jgi:hypothetical protein